jgi:uncharacterized protein (DUF433 family)
MVAAMRSGSRASTPEARWLPSYAPSEAAHYLGIPVSTVRYWCVGSKGNKRLIEPAEVSPLALSFVNLVELHVLGAIRRRHLISMPKVRRTLEFVSQKLGVDQPLARKSFETDGVDLFVEHYGRLINATKQGQTAMREVVGRALVRVEWDQRGLPVKLAPFTRSDTASSAEIIVIDPAVLSGRAIIRGTRIAVDVVAERYKAGESIRDLAHDYGREAEEIEEAIRCELQVA